MTTPFLLALSLLSGQYPVANCPNGQCAVAYYPQPPVVYYYQPQVAYPQPVAYAQAPPQAACPQPAAPAAPPPAAVPAGQHLVCLPGQQFVQMAQPVAGQQMVEMPQQAPAAVQQAVRQAQTVVAVAAGDAGAFLAWLNGTRAAYGLGAVAWDDGIAADCHHNNLMQAAYGMGHHFLGRARRQNAAAGLIFPGVESAWMGSPGHRDALLDPTITRAAVAWYGAYATFGAN